MSEQARFEEGKVEQVAATRRAWRKPEWRTLDAQAAEGGAGSTDDNALGNS